ncbi:MAG TPA: glutamate 5-kinase [Dehalococcoidia bacterium]|jgi:glutamate 5-kinase|nr:glutamate 5-kinase [Chloroflexota bacterium]MDP6055453.1 glutamate 5-kinase [Dehalococcoidia bacterium]MDP7090768.1 glutamate 5-kinase [Dehalococcoidia bacterium]MDP7261758.1 glutamate 5-kinase [Dehalococcoidia bacterium]MDP7484571.1 glutamate 5-kinase [Dehalococcoidia bacterium]|tara:strand:+ start:3211 stop:4356 length:1146 start_codon:yes stop_codon:yes gene_type:complete
MAKNNKQPKRIVVKLGTNLLTSGKDSLDLETIGDIFTQVAAVKASGIEVLIVTSGAVAAGRDSLSRTSGKDKLQRGTVAYRQALAALGQPQLMMTFEQLFAEHNVEVAQALISRGDLQSRSRYLNVRNTLDALLSIGAVPILNENDVVAVEELAGEVYGDNDRLSAMVANTVDADLLILLGDMDGLHVTDPHIDPNSELISTVDKIDDTIEKAARGPHDRRSRGGMASKLDAARLAMDSGIPMVIASGRIAGVIETICNGEQIGTRFVSSVSHRESRKRWILTGRTEHRGSVAVDAGAANAIKSRGNSLLPIGIVSVSGPFERGDIIEVTEIDGTTIGWGLASYPSSDVDLIKGENSKALPDLLGHYYGAEVIHRNNMALP